MSSAFTDPKLMSDILSAYDRDSDWVQEQAEMVIHSTLFTWFVYGIEDKQVHIIEQCDLDGLYLFERDAITKYLDQSGDRNSIRKSLHVVLDDESPIDVWAELMRAFHTS